MKAIMKIMNESGAEQLIATAAVQKRRRGKYLEKRVTITKHYMPCGFSAKRCGDFFGKHF